MKKENEGEEKKERRKKKYVRGKEEKGERKENGSDSQCSDGRKLIGQELKLTYSTRAMSRCQKQKR